MKYHYHSFNFLITLKVDKIMKFSYSKRGKNDQLIHYNFMVFGYYDFGFYELLDLPIRINLMSKFSYFGRAWEWESSIRSLN